MSTHKHTKHRHHNSRRRSRSSWPLWVTFLICWILAILILFIQGRRKETSTITTSKAPVVSATTDIQPQQNVAWTTDFGSSNSEQTISETGESIELENSPETYDESYVEGLNFIPSNVDVVYYNQNDSRWADRIYGGSDVISIYGCGPTSLSMAVSTLTDTTLTPLTAAQWAYNNGYWCENSGSYHSVIPDGAENYGLQAESVSAMEGQKIINALASGDLVIGVMSRGHFTNSGHFIVLHGITEDGKVLVADSNSEERSSKAWEFGTVHGNLEPFFQKLQTTAVWAVDHSGLSPNKNKDIESFFR